MVPSHSHSLLESLESLSLSIALPVQKAVALILTFMKMNQCIIVPPVGGSDPSTHTAEANKGGFIGACFSNRPRLAGRAT